MSLSRPNRSWTAGIRSAAATKGEICQDPAGFEDRLLLDVVDTSRLAVRCERSRVLRPADRPNILAWSLDAAPWYSSNGHNDGVWPWSAAVQAAGQHLLAADELVRVGTGRYARWVQIALAETHETPARRYPDVPWRKVEMVVGLRADGPPLGPTQLPLVPAHWELWLLPADPARADRAAVLVRRQVFASLRPAPAGG